MMRGLRRTWDADPDAPFIRGTALVTAVIGVFLFIVSAPARAGAGRCGPQVILGGDPALSLAVSRALQRDGIAIATDEDDCPAVRAHVMRRGARIDVLIFPLSQKVRPSERLVEDVGTAKTLIESWVRSDISAPLLAGHAPAPPPDPPAEVVAPELVLRAPGPVRRLPGFTVSALGEVAVGVTGSVWPGAGLSACAHVGPTCLGLSLHLSGDAALEKSGDLLARRFSADILLGAELPLHFGGLQLSPGLGLGVGYLRTSFEDDAADPIGDGGLRAEVHLTASLAVRHGLFLDLSVALTGAFFGSGGVVCLDRRSNQEDPAGSFDRQPLSAAPWGFLRTGLGLRWSTL